MTRLLQLALLLSSLCAGSSQAALYLDPDGRGQVLIFPYYTVNAGNDTLLSISNDTGAAKALKVRFREGMNGRVTAQLNVYLAPYDMWTAALFELAPTSAAGLTTFDDSCTVPGLKRSILVSLPTLPNGQRYLPLSAADYSGSRADAGPDTPERSREGWIEVIEMGVLAVGSPPALAVARRESASFNLPDCAVLEQSWIDGDFAADPTRHLLPPGGGLSGRAYYVKVAEGTAFALRATAIGGFSREVQHSAPEAGLPDLSTPRTEAQGVDFVSSKSWTERGQVRSTWPRSQAVDAVSAVLMQSRADGEVMTETGLSAATEWLLALPTRPWHTDQARVGTQARPPFSVLFPAAGQALPNRADCESVEVRRYERDGRFRPYDHAFYGLSVPPHTLCHAGQVITFDQGAGLPSRVLGSTRWLNLSSPDPFQAGHAQLDLATLPQRRLVSREGHAYEGLPVIGHAVEQFGNRMAQPGGVSAVYTESSPLVGTLRCRIATPPAVERDCGED